MKKKCFSEEYDWNKIPSGSPFTARIEGISVSGRVFIDCQKITFEQIEAVYKEMLRLKKKKEKA